MKIAVLGTGTVGQTIGAKLIELGHHVMMGSRSSTNEKGMSFAAKHPGMAEACNFATAAKACELVINCIKGESVIDALTLAGAENLRNKIILDLSNPLDFSNGMPPSLIPGLSNTNSLGEEIQKLFPESKVVKTLNTMWCGIMVNPSLVNKGDHTNFICGNDSDAKTKVIALLNQFGWKNENILDLGDITAARGTEAILPVWLRIWGATKSGTFNFKIMQ